MKNANLKYNNKVVNAVNHQTINSDTTTAGSAIDTKGYDNALVVLKTATVSAGVVTPLIEESDESGSGFTAVPDDYLHGTEADAAVTASNTVKTVGVILTKRYLKVSFVSTSSANMGVGAIAVLGGPGHMPVA